jgi:hypothetical protein
MASPAGLDHSGDLPSERKETEANPAELELAVIAARTPAYLAAVVVARSELGGAVEFRELRGTSHGLGS